MNSNKAIRILSAIGGLALVSTLPIAAQAQQSMKVSDGGMGNGKVIKIGDCGPLVVTTPGQSQRVPNAGTAAKSKPDAIPGADAVWQVVSPGVINYCVRSGVVNNGTAPSAAPWTLTLVDGRSANDPGYAEDHSTAGKTKPNTHPAAPARAGTATQPVPASSVSTLPDTWCVTNLRWEKRPRLALTLTTPSTGTATPPIVCRVDIKDEKKLATNANILTALGGNAVVIDTSTTFRPSPTTSLPAKKIELPKAAAPKQ